MSSSSGTQRQVLCRQLETAPDHSCPSHDLECYQMHPLSPSTWHVIHAQKHPRRQRYTTRPEATSCNSLSLCSTHRSMQRCQWHRSASAAALESPPGWPPRLLSAPPLHAPSSTSCTASQVFRDKSHTHLELKTRHGAEHTWQLEYMTPQLP